jgi:hypothetical protein
MMTSLREGAVESILKKAAVMRFCDETLQFFEIWPKSFFNMAIIHLRLVQVIGDFYILAEKRTETSNFRVPFLAAPCLSSIRT